MPLAFSHCPDRARSSFGWDISDGSAWPLARAAIISCGVQDWRESITSRSGHLDLRADDLPLAALLDFLRANAVVKDHSWPVTWSLHLSLLAQHRDDQNQLTPVLTWDAALLAAMAQGRISERRSA